MQHPRITHKRQFVQSLLIAAALPGPVRDIKVAANQDREITFIIHSAKNSPPPEKLQLQLLSGDRPAASVTVSP